MAKFSALLDACVIFPYYLCDTLLDAAQAGLYQVYFSERILEEATRNRVKRGKMNQASADRFCVALINTFPEALVEAPAELENKMENDPKDRHVLASAVYGKVDVIVTSSLKDFPTSSLVPWGIKVMSPDDFLNYLCDENGDDVLYDVTSTQAAAYKKSFDRERPDKKPPVTYLEFVSVSEKEQPKFASRMLIYAYGDEVDKFARKALINVTDGQKGQRCFNGSNYKICEVGDDIVIAERNTRREVFRSCDDEFMGDIKVKDIEAFNKKDSL